MVSASRGYLPAVPSETYIKTCIPRAKVEIYGRWMLQLFSTGRSWQQHFWRSPTLKYRLHILSVLAFWCLLAAFIPPHSTANQVFGRFVCLLALINESNQPALLRERSAGEININPFLASIYVNFFLSIFGACVCAGVWFLLHKASIISGCAKKNNS